MDSKIKRVRALNTSAVVEAFGWAYVIAFFIWLILRAFWFDAHWVLALINDSALYLFTPLLLFLPYALWQHKYALLLTLLVPCAMFVFWYGARFIPRAQAHAENARATFSVMSFNLHYDNWDLDAFAQTLRAQPPDIVGLQEVSAPNRAFIETRLADLYPHRAFLPIRERHSVALLSRYPISNIETMPDVERALRATVHLPRANINVIVAHLAPPNMFTYPLKKFVPLARERFETRRVESARLQDIGACENDPAVLLCDCNMSDTSKTYQTIAASWRDTFVERGWGLGHTLRFFLPPPLQRYDYVWHNRALRAAEFHIGQDSGSDHLPVSATFYQP